MSYCQARVIAKPILPLMDISKSMGGSMGTIKGNYVFFKSREWFDIARRGGGDTTMSVMRRDPPISLQSLGDMYTLY